MEKKDLEHFGVHESKEDEEISYPGVFQFSSIPFSIFQASAVQQKEIPVPVIIVLYRDDRSVHSVGSHASLG